MLIPKKFQEIWQGVFSDVKTRGAEAGQVGSIRGKKFTARHRRAGHGLTIHPAQRYNYTAQRQPPFTAIILFIVEAYRFWIKYDSCPAKKNYRFASKAYCC